MKIIRVNDRISKSTVDGSEIKELPLRLRVLLRRLLADLKRVKTITIDQEPQKAILEFSSRNATILSLSAKTRRQFIATMSLLQWYKRKHWYSHRPAGMLGGTIYCNDCDLGIIAGSAWYCQNSACPSHEKWRQVIGPSYKPPENPMIDFTEISKQ